MASRIYETAIKIGATISRTFRADVLNASTAITRLGGETKKLKAAAESAAAFEQLSQRVAASKQRYDTAAAAVRRMEAAQRTAGKASKESAAMLAVGKKAVEAEAKELDRLNKALGTHSKRLAEAQVGTADLAAEQRRLAVSIAAKERSAAALGSLAAARRRLMGEGAGAAPVLPQLAERARGLVSDATRIAVAAGAAGGALLGLAHRTVEAGDEIGDTAANLAIGTTALQELRFAAERGGSSAEDLDKGLAKFNQTVGDALTGNKAAAKSFADVGIAVGDLEGLTTEQRFNRFADAIGKIEDPSKRAAAAQNFLGKTSKSMVALLADGSAGIAELRAQSVGILSPTAIANASKAKDAMQTLQASIGGVGNILGAELLPIVTRVMDRLGMWIGQNQRTIQRWAAQAAWLVEEVVIPAFEKLVPEVLSAITTIAGLVNGAAGLVGGFRNLALVMVALRFAPLASSIASVGVEVVRGTVALVRYVAAKWAAVAATRALNAAEAEGTAKGGGAATGLVKRAGQLAAVGAAAVAFRETTTGAADIAAGAVAGRGGGAAAQRTAGAVTAGQVATMLLPGIGPIAALADLVGRKPTSPAAVSPATVAPGAATRPATVLQFSPTVNVRGGETAPGDVKAAIDAATPGLLERVKQAVRAERENERRLSFG